MSDPTPGAMSPDQANPDEVPPEEATQAEIEEDAAGAGDDPVTRREALETELMAEGESESGEEIGETTP